MLAESRGLSMEAEQLYRALLDGRPTTPGAELAELERFGLVRSGASGVEVCPPRAALSAFAAQHEAAAVRAREAAEVLGAAYSLRTGRDADFVEVLRSRDEVIATFEAMQTQSGVDIVALDPGSYMSPKAEVSTVQPGSMARGIAYRVVYDSSVLQDDDGFAQVQSSIALGEQARVFPRLPLKLVIADSRRALIAVPNSDAGDVLALLIHPSMLLSALIELFESFWRMAVPVRAGGPDDAEAAQEPTIATRRLLALLSGGLTDEAIARELGVSERTVLRRISRLQQLLGAQTRFQLGAQASRQGWL
ncbi:LuxR family transcriptional regulator [Amycolatopsis oliviviridis]|uniref:Transcriptional regulator n=1 Tax=Amycolatopsis oliviviridis TaxID=1471590 RepID=A0ABQ3L3B1_9PSEU|nr:helix-turn-helix transcriptional regulator [Amycolatopsis oliviviridis]GHH01711.1 transcriptional regulator [Amycolatopsis oliviviridis]